MRLLVAVDFSAFSEEVIRQIESRPWPSGTQARLLHVVDTITLSSGMINLGPYFELQTAAATKMLESLAARLTDKRISTSIEVVMGYPASRIPDYADEWKPTLIMIGSHGRHALTNLLLGSVASAVLRKTGESIEIVRCSATAESAQEGLKILLATDGSACSDLAVHFVAKQPWSRGSAVEIVSVAEAAMPPIDPWVGADQILARINQETHRQAQDSLSAAGRVFEGSGIKFTAKILSGNAKAAIVEEARQWNAGLVVVGSHGRQGLTRMMVGSVAEAVAAHAPCSVEVIRVEGSKDWG
jgi:nucleotide-binding universal stress UspA family protein